MLSKTAVRQAGTLASIALADAYTDFVLSRQSKNATGTTMEFYRHTAAKFLEWAESQGVSTHQQITAFLVRQYLAELAERGKKDTTLHAHARAIRTLLKFWHAEGYLEKPVKFDMPKLSKKRLPVLSADELKQAIGACKSKRDKALLLFLADSGLRRAEVCALNWEDVDMQTGLVRVKQGKGRKDRSAVVSPVVRRELLQYRRTARSAVPLFLSRTGDRLTGSGVLLVFRRLSKETGIHITPHALRRTFTILSLRNGMDVLHLQGLGGWASLEMVYHYAQMEDGDLLQAHAAHSPIGGLR